MSTIKKITAFIAFFLLMGLSVLGQNDDPTQLPKFIPPSPNAAALGEYGQVPVGLFTGTPQINIPLYNLQGKYLSLPVSLNYSSNGVKVDQIASHVGMSWTLSAGGVITRTVLDEPDELERRIIYDSNNEDEFVKNVAQGSGVDSQPDSYSFNFNGYSGTFYLADKTYEPVLLSPTPIKIVLLQSGITNIYLPKFKIITPDGVSYYFGGTKAVDIEISITHCTPGSHPDPSREINSAWYLTKIVHPLGEEIELKYEVYKLAQYPTGISQNLTRVENFGGPNNYCENSELVTCTSYKKYSSISYLKEINSTSGKVLLNYDFSPDHSFIPERIRLKNIMFYNSYKKVKEFDFEYTIINSNSGSSTTFNTRRFLTQIVEKSSEGEAKTPYLFDYYKPESLPPRFSYSQDFWGYYNGKNNTTFLPTILNKGLSYKTM